ncbi:MAG: DUF58 domain-containing protein [Nocardioidaceae bacterium]
MRAALKTLTTRGRAFLSAGITCALCALVLGQQDLLRVAFLVIALPIFTALLANRSRYLIASSRTVAPARVQTGQTTTVTLSLENPGRAPTGLMLLEDQVPYALGSRPRFVLEQLRPKWDREMTYVVRSETRGRFAIGPLTVRVSDPFGFVELSRAFTARTELVVTPVVHTLPTVSLSGDWSGTGENRPRAFAASGTEDVTVREYRLGDDLRRIHWRTTARMDELMVRREEQPHQSRATLFLDSRAMAHRGTGPSSSFEFAVSAVASASAHLARHGFVVRMLTDGLGSADATWHDRGISGPAQVEMLLDSLAVIQPGTQPEFHTGSPDHSPPGLVVAVLGGVSGGDIAALSSLRVGSTRALAILLDVAAWTRAEPGAPSGLPTAEEQATMARRNGWSVVIARPGDHLAELWKDLANAGSLRTFSSAVPPEDQAGPAA